MAKQKIQKAVTVPVYWEVIGKVYFNLNKMRREFEFKLRKVAGNMYFDDERD